MAYLPEGSYGAAFYNSDKDLALSFGRSTVTYRAGTDGIKYFRTFYDRYDFDFKPWNKVIQE
jgi:hypothetical protein